MPWIGKLRLVAFEIIIATEKRHYDDDLNNRCNVIDQTFWKFDRLIYIHGKNSTFEYIYKLGRLSK